MKITLAFDVYGTLVDPSGMAEHLTQDLGDKQSMGHYRSTLCGAMVGLGSAVRRKDL